MTASNDPLFQYESDLPVPIRQLLQNMLKVCGDAAVWVTLRKDTPIVKGHDPSTLVYLVVSGQMEALAEFPSGIHYSFSKFTAFDMVGELEAITGDGHYAITVKAQTTCKAFCLPKETFLDWLRQCPSDSLTVCSLLAEKLFAQLKANRSFLFLDSIDRFALHLIACYQQQNLDSSLCLSSTRQQIADEIGFCTKTVNRCVKRLAEQGYISLERNKIVVDQEQYQRLLALDIKPDYS
ncbi:Crp/Fnr family transcriptional regulator [Acetonema longum]|uniref:Transcriptional regulator, Crp/Fnr family protein n=1 Tax=Acetonema longum DSM 6540 TaxID=1009370 RepID=F7NI77_9FIRM|nr:Crp/Fnr family transcriptional regulator [Acetonema longum]EGO64242.1 transcriptional regulator, Crp/Fnr family protein [Acetonema longum DSM 6540]